MGTYNFKSAGTTQTNATANQLASAPTPIGILTPLQLGSSGTDGLLKTSYDLATQAADNLRNLLQTNWGERLGLYDFGANLRPLMSELVSLDDFDSQAIVRIKAAVQRWMPYIDLEDFETQTIRTGNLTQSLAQIALTVTYNIPNLNVSGKQVRVTLYAV